MSVRLQKDHDLRRPRKLWLLACVLVLTASQGQRYFQSAYPNGLHYRSSATLAGFPLVDIRYPSRDRIEELRDLPLSNALDEITACGWFSSGMISAGVITFGVASIGIASFGVGAVGMASFAVVSIAVLRAVGVFAISLMRSAGVVSISIGEARGVFRIDRHGIQTSSTQ